MNKISSFLLAIILSVGIVGCSKRNSPEVEKTTEENAQKTEENVKKEDVFTKEEYKDLIVKNHEKYLSPIERKDEKVDDDLDENKDLSNEEIVNHYRTLLTTSQNNIESFKEAISNVKVDDKNLQELNTTLIQDAHDLVEEIVKKTDSFNHLNEDLLRGSKSDLTNNIENELDKNNSSEEKFDTTLEKIEQILGIDLDK
ncbi:MAG: hypothetical protein ACRDD7_14770 [Peptostreptococcaceae bacterium]